MDTREKIVRVQEVPAHLGDECWLAVVGLFDPLTTEQAARLAKLSERGKPLLAVVEESDGALLPAEARAVLVAALRPVSLVVIAMRSELSHLPQLEMLSDDEGEQTRTRGFITHVLAKQKVVS